ncbi:hypothetical protein Tco_0293917 [Tanacetum coccineum]
MLSDYSADSELIKDDPQDAEEDPEDEPFEKEEEPLALAAFAPPLADPASPFEETEPFEGNKVAPTPPSPVSPHHIIPLSQTRLHRAWMSVWPQSPLHHLLMHLLTCGLLHLHLWKRISDKRTKNQAKTDKTEHGMEKRGKDSQIEAKFIEPIRTRKLKQQYQNDVELEYHVSQCKAAVLTEAKWNSDEDYVMEEKYTTSITKHYAARYYKQGIKDMIPDRWCKETHRYIFEALNVRRSDYKEYEFSYANLPRLNLNDVEDMYLLQTDMDVKKSNEMVDKIDKVFKCREQLRRLEEYVGGRPKTVNPHTFNALWIYWIRGNDEEVLTDEELFDLKGEILSDGDKIAEIFRIETDIFDFETPLCEAFKEFNYLLKIDVDVFTKDIPGFKTEPIDDIDHVCKPIHFKSGHTQWPTCNWKEEGCCNGGDLPAIIRIGSNIHFQDYEWYEGLKDGELKEEALKEKAILEGLWGHKNKKGMDLIKDEEESNQADQGWFDNHEPMEDNDDDIGDLENYLVRNDGPYYVDKKDERSKERRYKLLGISYMKPPT